MGSPPRAGNASAAKLGNSLWSYAEIAMLRGSI
jgi:hypothetical protein